MRGNYFLDLNLEFFLIDTFICETSIAAELQNGENA